MANRIENHGLPDAPINVTNTGFTFGALTVDRLCTLRNGVACVRLETPTIAFNIRVTKTGRVRIYMDNGMEVLTMHQKGKTNG